MSGVSASVVKQVAQEQYARLVAILASKTGDLTAAEDALADAFARALVRWPERGVPDNPAAWLLTVAKNNAIDAARRSRSQPSALQPVFDQPLAAFEVGDERLRLMFVCAHPAIDEAIHAPLMLQVVLGLQVSEIAPAFCQPKEALAQRLVRAKKKIKLAKIPFVLPDSRHLIERRDAVLEAIYAVFSLYWIGPGGGALRWVQQSEQLAGLLASLLPSDAEVLGLLALIDFSRAREQARFINGVFVPLHEQDRTLWSQQRLLRGRRRLHLAADQGQLGRFQLEAAIAEASCGSPIHWLSLARLYEGLLQIAPTLGALVGCAHAVSKAVGASAGLHMLDGAPKEALNEYQPAWATRAELHRQLGQRELAIAAYERAISLCEDVRVAEFLRDRLKEL